MYVSVASFTAAFSVKSDPDTIARALSLINGAVAGVIAYYEFRREFNKN
jgi:hypothetical protein